MSHLNLTADNAALIICAAFTPLRCVAEPWDYGERVRFRVFDSSDEPVLTVDELLKKQFADAGDLRSVVNSWRTALAERGFELLNWEFPTTPTMSR